MRKRILGIALATAVAGVGMAFAALPASATDSTARQSQEAVHAQHVTKGSTTITIDAATSKATKAAGLRIISSYRHARTDVIELPVIGVPKDGKIEHLGGVAIIGKTEVVTLTRLAVDTKRGVVTARVNLSPKAVDVFKIGASTQAGATLTLTATAAATLNTKLGVKVFTDASAFAYANVVLR
ncbi:hypothetical protein [Lentzea sp. HUAS12]|uniref:hypothetical protein n=1 Tax=Lentzea sp. HUAS12 TaxID=2951806 RepID=UPI00209E17A3|nr:hypothetical protein [Lentzea sp. HUAS12]USX56254.1 hypothetical protein ND450_19775 [Lentzea sp. HUAS12]